MSVAAVIHCPPHDRHVETGCHGRGYKHMVIMFVSAAIHCPPMAMFAQAVQLLHYEFLAVDNMPSMSVDIFGRRHLLHHDFLVVESFFAMASMSKWVSDRAQRRG